MIIQCFQKISCRSEHIEARTTKMAAIRSLPLSQGPKPIPTFGLGTFRASGNDCHDSCLAALRAGYRLLDTAALYENEDQVGTAIEAFLAEQTAVTRDDLFIVTKLHWDSHGGDIAVAKVEESLRKLKLTYVDLFLMHSPKGNKVVETYKGLLEAKSRGLTRAVGVSNFGKDQLIQLLATGVEVPAVNQIELHVWNQQRELTLFCQQHNILVMAFCPLARGDKFGKTRLTAIAERLGISEATLCNYWVLKSGFVTIPKSVKPERITGNLDVLELRLTANDVAELDTLDEAFECSLAMAAQRIPWSEVA
jgi:diketogulonate reductase-like aldo/keto reductase